MTTIKTKERQTGLEAEQTRMSGQVSNLIDYNYERQAVRLVTRRLMRRLGISQVEILRAIMVQDKPDVTNLLYRVTAEGVVSDDEADDLEFADMILRGQTPEGATVHVVAEVSLTIQEADINRAARRAAVLERATRGTTYAVVIGESGSPANLELANQKKVVFIQIIRRQK